MVQNIEAFQFLDEKTENHEMHYESAFSLQGGKKVVLLGRLPKVDTVVPGDDSLRYILMSLHHDGSGPIRFGRCAARVICANTYAIALAEGYVKELSVPHKGDVKAKLAQARNILGLANEKFDQYAQQTRVLERFCRRPYRSCWLLEGPPGTGKSASAHAVSKLRKAIRYAHSILQEGRQLWLPRLLSTPKGCPLPDELGP